MGTWGQKISLGLWTELAPASGPGCCNGAPGVLLSPCSPGEPLGPPRPSSLWPNWWQIISQPQGLRGMSSEQEKLEHPQLSPTWSQLSPQWPKLSQSWGALPRPCWCPCLSRLPRSSCTLDTLLSPRGLAQSSAVAWQSGSEVPPVPTP